MVWPSRNRPVALLVATDRQMEPSLPTWQQSRGLLLTWIVDISLLKWSSPLLAVAMATVVGPKLREPSLGISVRCTYLWSLPFALIPRAFRNLPWQRCRIVLSTLDRAIFSKCNRLSLHLSSYLTGAVLSSLIPQTFGTPVSCGPTRLLVHRRTNTGAEGVPSAKDTKGCEVPLLGIPTRTAGQSIFLGNRGYARWTTAEVLKWIILILVRPLSLIATPLQLPFEAEPSCPILWTCVSTDLSPSAILTLIICDEALGTSKFIAKLGRSCDGPSPMGSSGTNVIFIKVR